MKIESSRHQKQNQDFVKAHMASLIRSKVAKSTNIRPVRKM